MATTKAFTASRPGPVSLNVATDSPDIHIVIDPDRFDAHIEVSTSDDEGPAVDAVNAATIDERGDTITVKAHQNAVNAHQNVVFGRDQTVINAGVIHTGSGSVNVSGSVLGSMSFNVSPVTVTATLPPESLLSLRSASGDVTIKGHIQWAHVTTASGDVDLDGNCQMITVRTASGDVDLDGIAETVNVMTASGDVTIGRGVDIDIVTASGDVKIEEMAGDARVNTGSGDVKMTAVAGATHADLSSMSGDITTRGGEGIPIDARSMSGRVRSR